MFQSTTIYHHHHHSPPPTTTTTTTTTTHHHPPYPSEILCWNFIAISFFLIFRKAYQKALESMNLNESNEDWELESSALWDLGLQVQVCILEDFVRDAYSEYGSIFECSKLVHLLWPFYGPSEHIIGKKMLTQERVAEKGPPTTQEEAEQRIRDCLAAIELSLTEFHNVPEKQVPPSNQ
jgi:hypothetical protein